MRVGLDDSSALSAAAPLLAVAGLFALLTLAGIVTGRGAGDLLTDRAACGPSGANPDAAPKRLAQRTAHPC